MCGTYGVTEGKAVLMYVDFDRLPANVHTHEGGESYKTALDKGGSEVTATLVTASFYITDSPLDRQGAVRNSKTVLNAQKQKRMFVEMGEIYRKYLRIRTRSDKISILGKENVTEPPCTYQQREKI